MSGPRDTVLTIIDFFAVLGYRTSPAVYIYTARDKRSAIAVDTLTMDFNYYLTNKYTKYTIKSYRRNLFTAVIKEDNYSLYVSWNVFCPRPQEKRYNITLSLGSIGLRTAIRET